MEKTQGLQKLVFLSDFIQIADIEFYLCIINDTFKLVNLFLDKFPFASNTLLLYLFELDKFGLSRRVLLLLALHTHQLLRFLIHVLKWKFMGFAEVFHF
jgi:hypothetical protein